MMFSTLLIANRGEIARRVIRGAHSMGVRCIAVYVDADAYAPHVNDADEAIRLPGGYLDQDAILDAARKSGAEAVHPGYGYLSENAEFASRVRAAGLIWVGPSPDVIAAMGDKLVAKEMAIKAGIATLASSDDPSNASTVGFPLMVKAAAGGGGKGMRIVTDAQHLDEAVAGAQREAAHGFGDDRVFLERYVARSRHIEIQILGDHHGNLVHLGERECSIQRRHQKLIEESPSPFVDEAMRVAMGDAALALARVIGYQSVGTVEFLVDDETGEFYFLEVNTRLQVEHPVTEEVTGIDLVQEQLRIAANEELGYDQGDIEFSGSAIEVRLCAEDPANGFLPATGTMLAFEPADEPYVRFESGIERGSVVTVSFDPLLAKVIAFAASRTEAASTLALALERLHLGGVATNRDLLVATLRHEEFLLGNTTTDFIERVQPARSLHLNDEELLWASTAAALWLQALNRDRAHVLARVPSGWRNARLPSQCTSLRFFDRVVDVYYRARRDGTFEVNDTSTARVLSWSGDHIDVEIDGRRARSRVTRSGDTLLVQVARGTATLELVPRFVVPEPELIHGGLIAPMPGNIIDVRVNVGDDIVAGQTLIVIEAMKMEHIISAPTSGTVTELFVATGQQVDNGAVLLAIDSTDTQSSGD